MAFKFEIRDTHFLVITDTTIVDPVETMVLDMPKADAYYDHRLLKVRTDLQKSEHVYIYDKNDTSTDGAKMFNEPLAECQDDTGTPFTKASFITWMRTNTGFKQAPGSGALPWLYSATNYTELSTIIAPAANEGELAIVYNSQGTWLINRKLKGVYIYQSGVWEYANQELQNRLAAKIDSVSGDGVDNTDPLNPVLTFPTPAEIGAKPNFSENTAFNKNFGNSANEVLEGNTRIITPAEIITVSNQSGTNTGDETTLTIQNKRPLKTVNGNSLEGVGDIPINVVPYIKDTLIVTSISNNFSSNTPTNIPDMTYTVSGLSGIRDFIFYAAVLTNNDQNEELDFFIAKNGSTDLDQVIIEIERKNQDQSIQGTFSLDGLVNGDVITFQFDTRSDNVDIKTRRILIQSWE